MNLGLITKGYYRLCDGWIFLVEGSNIYTVSAEENVF